MNHWGMTSLCLLILATLALASSCSSTGGISPQIPAQIPTTVEQADGGTGGSLAVQTGKSLNFVAKDASGEIVDPNLVVAQIVTKDGEVLDYGTVAAADDYIVNTTENYFPNVESQYQINFYKNSAGTNLSKALLEDDLLATFDVDVSVGPEDVADSTIYQFSDPEELDTYQAMNPNIVVTDENKIVFVCYRKFNWDCEVPAYEGCGITSTDLVFVKSEDNGKTFGDSRTVVHYTDGDNQGVLSFCGISVIDSETVGEETIALTWGTNQPGPPNGYSSPGEGADIRTRRFYVIKSTDGGDTFGDALLVDEIPVNINDPEAVYVDTIESLFDVNGLLHVIYDDSTEESANGDVYYAFCNDTSCDGNIQINSSDDSLAGTNVKYPIAIYTGTDSVKIYTLWEDIRNSEERSMFGMPYDTSNLRFAEIVYSGGTATVARDIQVDTVDGYANVGAYIDIDSRHNPIIAWTYAVGGDVFEDFEYEIFMRRWDATLETFSNNIEFTDRSDNGYSALGFMSIDSSDRLHFYYSEITVDDGLQNFLSAPLIYSMGTVDLNDSGDYTYVAEATRDTSESISYTDKHASKFAMDKAGRLYFIWEDYGADGVPDNSIYIMNADIVTDSN